MKHAIRPGCLGLAAALLSVSVAGAAGTVWEEYEQTRAEISELSALVTAKDREVLEKYGSRDAPEALAVVAPIRERLIAARNKQRHLLCWDRPRVASPSEMFASLGLPMDGRRVDRARLDAFVTAKSADGTLTQQDADRLRFTLAMAGHGVMNPSSLGAGTVNQRIAKALRCYGLDSEPAEAGSASSRRAAEGDEPRSASSSGLRYFRTCGDVVCEEGGYRGPFGVTPVCRDQKAGDRCDDRGARCDLANDCNMFLVCTDEDPSTRCPR